MCVCVCVCVYALRIVSVDKILRTTNTLIIIIINGKSSDSGIIQSPQGREKAMTTFCLLYTWLMILFLSGQVHFMRPLSKSTSWALLLAKGQECAQQH